MNKGMQTEQTKESVDCLELENCTLKNMKDQLKSEMESMKSIHAVELKNLSDQIDVMTKRNDELNKKLQLTNEVIQSNNNFKKEINDLKEKVKSFDACVIDQDRLKKEIDGLREQFELKKQALVDYDGLKQKQSILENDLEAAERTIEYLKVNVVSDITEKILGNEKDEMFCDDGTWASNFDVENVAAGQRTINTGSTFPIQPQQSNQNHTNRYNRQRSNRGRPKSFVNEPHDRRVLQNSFSRQNDQRFFTGNQNGYRSRFSNRDYVKNGRNYQKNNRYG